MPLVPRKTTAGTPLHSKFRGGESDTVREVPPEWRAALELFVEETPVPFDSDIPFLSDEILATKIEQKVTAESTLRTTSKPAGDSTLEEIYTDKHKQIGHRTRNFKFIDELPFIAVPTATRDVNTKNFGNKHFEETIDDDGTLFVDQTFERTRPD